MHVHSYADTSCDYAVPNGVLMKVSLNRWATGFTLFRHAALCYADGVCRSQVALWGHKVIY